MPIPSILLLVTPPGPTVILVSNFLAMFGRRARELSFAFSTTLGFHVAQSSIELFKHEKYASFIYQR